MTALEMEEDRDEFSIVVTIANFFPGRPAWAWHPATRINAISLGRLNKYTYFQIHVK